MKLLVMSLIGGSFALPVVPSSGCGATYSGVIGELTRDQIFVNEDNGLSTQRSFTSFVPEIYDTSDEVTPYPLMFYFHGQYGNAHSDASSSSYVDYPMIQLYPQGIGPQDGGGCGTGWDTGPSGHDANTCTSEAYSSSCCYDSCKAIGLCSGSGKNANCGWSTCYSDSQFVLDLLNKTTTELCVDLNSIFVTGLSNGGMLTHYLYQELPGIFSAAMPVYGLPLVGYNTVTNANNATSILQLHDRSDTIIPVSGGDAGGWYYESADDVLGAWASVHGCSSSDTPTTTPYDGGKTNLACTEWAGCAGGKRVMLCMYDGQHGSWPSQGEALTFWFFNQTRYFL